MRCALRQVRRLQSELDSANTQLSRLEATGAATRAQLEASELRQRVQDLTAAVGVLEAQLRENAKLRAGHDRALMLWLEKKCRDMGTSLLALDCRDKRLYLSAQDKQDHVMLKHVGPMTVRFRVALIQQGRT